MNEECEYYEDCRNRDNFEKCYRCENNPDNFEKIEEDDRRPSYNSKAYYKYRDNYDPL